MKPRPDLLTVAEVAHLRGCGRVAAFRWLRRNAKKYLFQRGRFWVIAAEDYLRLTEPPLEVQIESRVAHLEELAREIERRLDVHAKSLSKLRAI